MTADEAIDGIVRPAVTSVPDPEVGGGDVVLEAVLVGVGSVVVAGLAVGDVLAAVPVPVVQVDQRLGCNGIGRVGAVDLGETNRRGTPCRRLKWCCNPSRRGLRRWRARSS